jgi:hypothetical protein
MTESDWLAEGFEKNRTRLRAVAYRMLGSPRPTTPSRKPGCAPAGQTPAVPITSAHG